MMEHLTGGSPCRTKALTLIERTLWELGLNRLAYKVFMRDWKGSYIRE